MIALIRPARKAAARLAALFAIAWLAACEPIGTAGLGGGPTIDTNAPVRVALLVPNGSGQSTDAFLARSLENGARLAIGDLNDAQIDLRVYNTAGRAGPAANAAQRAVADGAQIILGPLYAEAANAAGVAVAGNNVNVLAFSNNAAIAGGNVFILGPTFDNTADRLTQYGRRQGVNRYVIAHADTVPGATGRNAITAAVRSNGGTVVGVESYPLSQNGIVNAGPRIANTVQTTGAQAVFTTAVPGDELSVLATGVKERVPPAQLVGLTRWNSEAAFLTLPALQGGLFAIPDQSLQSRFEARYRAAYGEPAHPVAGLAYDGIAAIGALVSSGNRQALSASALTQRSGFRGTGGIFRLLRDGTNERALAVATIRNNRVVILDPAPTTFGRAGF
ncbi:penicillin-binding protein activator [Aestuariibius sp. 2305UL40-4]|uniref:penicillin-binding protein activator n=1 Tax=Aestuariibius violaceus TaxID=3234132 RepID=UPI00345E5725